MRVAELSPTTAAGLLRITSEDEYFQSDLYHDLDISSHTGSTIARTLANQGLIAREETTHNARRTYRLVPHPDLPGTLPTVTPAEARALVHLYRSPAGLAQNALTTQLGVTRKRTSTLARRLADKNLIHREPITQDGISTYRLIPISLTDLLENGAPDTHRAIPSADTKPTGDTPDQDTERPETPASTHQSPPKTGSTGAARTAPGAAVGTVSDRGTDGSSTTDSTSSPTARHTSDPGLSPTETRAMALIRGRGELPRRDLARGLGIDDEASEQLVRSLVDAGLVKTEEATLYGRSATLVSATDA